MISSRRLLPSTSMLMAFEASARHNSFTFAAKELHLSQGAISRQVAALEDQLGVQLFNRIGKTVEINEKGLVYAKEIRQALHSIRSASLDAISSTKGGILNLAILPTFGMRWLMPRFPNFLAGNPQVTVNFVTKLAPFDFRNEKLDAAIHYGYPDWPDTHSSFIMGEEVIPVASPAFLADRKVFEASDLGSLPLLHLETRPTAWENWFSQNGVDTPILGGATFEQFSIVTQAAIAGMGAALLPRFLIETELERGELAVILDRPLESEEGYYLVTPNNAAGHSPVTAFENWLLDQAS